MVDSDLFKSLQSLKEQLNNLDIIAEKEVEKEHIEKKMFELREDKNIRIEKKLYNILTKNEKSNILYINSGGKLFKTSRDVIKNCLYPNILQEKAEDGNKGYSAETALFVNIPKYYFKHILNIVRRFNSLELDDKGSYVSNLLQFGKKRKYSIQLKNPMHSRENLELFICKFFNGDSIVVENILISQKLRPFIMPKSTVTSKKQQKKALKATRYY